MKQDWETNPQGKPLMDRLQEIKDMKLTPSAALTLQLMAIQAAYEEELKLCRV